MRKPIFFATLSFLAISLIPTNITNGCGFYDYGYYVYTFTNPNIIEEPSYRPFFFTFMYYYDEWKGEEYAITENIKEWKSYFGNQGDDESYAQFIYKSSLKDIENFRAGKAPSSTLWSNDVVKILQAKKDEAFLDYMVFAKSCEPLAVDRDLDWEGNLQNVEQVKERADQLMEEGLTAFHSCESDFLKMRYTFQIVRLARYSMQWAETIRLYKDLMPEVKNVNSIIRYWTMEHYAGALYNLGKKAEAAYHFAQVFDKCGSRRKAAYRSFEITSDEMWQATLNLCKNNEEKAGLYVLRAIDPFSNTVEEMEAIYEIQPTSPHLELLLVREMQKFEYELLGASYNKRHDEAKFTGYNYNTDESFVQFPREDSKQYIKRLVDFAKKLKTSGQVQHPHLWQLAEGYLTFMNGNSKEAMRILNDLSKNKSLDKHFQSQITVFKAAIEVADFKEMNEANELRALELMPILKNVKPDVWGESNISEQADYLFDKMAMLYQKQGDYAKAYLAKKWGFDNLLYEPNLQVVSGLLDLYDKRTSFNAFEKEFTKPAFYDEEWTDNGVTYVTPNPEIKNQLLEMKGTLLLGDNQFETAIATFKQLPKEYLNQDYTFNQDDWDSPSNSRERFNISNRSPFHLYMNNQSVPVTDPTFNKLKLSETLLKLEEHVQSGGENLAEAYFMLGNIHFQTSSNGKAWRAKDYAWGYSSRYNYNENALVYLDKAIETGSKSDREWAAKACFVASACQTKDKVNNQKNYYKMLKEEYSDTEFYEQAIQECSWFLGYVNQ